MLLLLTSCFTSTSAEEEARRDDLSLEMQEHAAQTEAAREAIIAGNLKAANAAGQSILERIPVWDLPGSARTMEPALVVPTRALAEATTIDAAALALGEMGVACGSCHASQGVTLPLKAPEPPPTTEGFTEQMQRYHWAAERMWQGLILPSEAAIAESVAAIQALPTADFHPEWAESLPPGAQQTDAVVHQLAALTTTKQGWAYGSMLAACAACHTNLPGTPANQP